jgi:hypothetical protein
MSTNCRFALDERRYVIDAVNVANSGKGYCHKGNPEDDKHLRWRILMVLLGELVDKLIINLRPMQRYPTGQEYEPTNEEADAVEWAMLDTIRASHLNTFDPALSVQHKFDGKLRRQKEQTQDFTSLALFRDDVECLLRDLYGDLESEALDSVVRAVFRIVQQFTRYVRPDLWKEHEDAEDLDYLFGIGVPEGSAIHGSDCSRGWAAKRRLMHRACEVKARLSTFSEYTIEFANLFAQRWDCISVFLEAQSLRGAAAPIEMAPPEPPARSEEAVAPVRALASFEELVALAMEKRDIGIKSALERDVRLVRFEDGRLEFSLEPSAQRSLTGVLSKKLADWTGRRWMVIVSAEQGQPSLYAQAQMRKAELKDGVRADPLVQAVLTRFPGPEIVDVRAAVDASGGAPEELPFEESGEAGRSDDDF